MNNTLQRIALFVIVIPALAALILYVPYYDYIWIPILLGIIGIVCGIELRSMLHSPENPIPLWTVSIPGMAPVLSWLIGFGLLPSWTSMAGLLIVLYWAFSGVAFLQEHALHLGIKRLSSRLLMILYPSFFLWWMQRISQLPSARYACLIFALAVCLNDSVAWLVGNLIGRRRGLFATSPNKSLEGLIAGILVSMGVIFGGALLLPNLFPQPHWQVLIFGLVCGITTIIGDLVESAIKRAAGFKDSGHMIPGRGGMLDTMDSLLFTAPVFCFFLERGL